MAAAEGFRGYGYHPRPSQSFRRRMQAIGVSRTKPLTIRQKRQVKQIVRSGKEKKYKDTTAAAADVTSTVGFIQLSTISQGDGESERIGDSVACTSLHLKGTIGALGSAVTAGTAYYTRMIVFRWKPDTAAESPTAVTDILQAASAYSQVVGEDTQRNKFDILYDNFDTFIGRNGGNGRVNRDFDRFIKCKKKIHFNAALTTGSNHIYLMYYCNDATANAVEISYSARLRYVE